MERLLVADPSVSRVLVCMWHKRFSDCRYNERVGRPILTDERALSLVREVTDKACVLQLAILQRCEILKGPPCSVFSFS